MKERAYQLCRVTAMNLLARREHSKKELLRKLILRDFDEQTVGQVLSDLIQENLLSDRRFAEAFVRSRISKGQGPLRIRRDLSERGVADELIADYVNGRQWLTLAIDVRQKRFGNELPEGYKECARQMRFLQYRGFDGEQISGAMKQDGWQDPPANPISRE